VIIVQEVTMPAAKDGPYIQVAGFCESVIEDKSGVLSLIRMIDTLTHTEAAPNPPNEMPSFQFTFKLVIMLKSGSARGRHNLRVIPELPNGTAEKAVDITAYFEGEEKGQNIIVDMTFLFKMEGLYWFNVFLEETKLTSMPLRAKYNRIVIGSIPTTPAGN
jgi:hypothetical protein